MSKEEEIDKTRLKTLEQFMGFLGVILVLAMQIAWDYVSNWTNLSGNLSDITRALAIGFYFSCVIFLFGIVVFYRSIFLGDNREAEKIAIWLLRYIWIPLMLSFAPMVDLLIYNHSSENLFVEIFYIVDGIWLVFIFLLIGSYIIHIRKSGRFKTNNTT